MKKIELSQLQQEVVLGHKEALVVEDQGKTLGYFYPVSNQAEVQQAKQDLDQVMEKVLQETGWSEEELVAALTEKAEKQDTEKLWERLDKALDQATKESGLDKETLINTLDPRQPFPYKASPVKP